jgi:hypothetical protein
MPMEGSLTRQAENLWKAGDLPAALGKYEQLRDVTGSTAWNYQISRIRRLLADPPEPTRLRDFASLLTAEAGIERVYVVNLPHRPDRKARTLKELAAAGFQPGQIQFIEGVHGDSDPRAIHYNERFKTSPIPESFLGLFPSAEMLAYDKEHSTPGVFGYLLSQERVFRDAMDKGYRRIVVFDDDIFFPPAAAQTLRRFLKKVPDWKILLLGASNYFEPDFDPKDAFFPTAEALGFYSPIPLTTCGSFAVCYEKSMFPVLLELINDFSGYYDRHILGSLYKKHPGNCYGLWPAACCADVAESDIRSPRDVHGHARFAGWDVTRYEKYRLCVESSDT